MVFILYYLLVIGVGLSRLRRQSKSEYITAPNSTGVITLTLSLLGTIVGGGMFLGITDLGYREGLTVFALGVAYLVGSIIMGLLSPYIRRTCADHGVRTLFGLMDKLYPRANSVLPVLFTWMTFSVFLLMLAVQFLGIATFLRFYIGIEFKTALMFGAGGIAAISTLLYSAFGGFRKDLVTDVLQIGFIGVGALAIVIGGLPISDLRPALSALPPSFFTIRESGIVLFVGSLFFVAPTFFIRFDLWQRVITAKSERTAKIAFVVSGLLAFCFFGFFGILGMYCRATDVGDSQTAALAFIERSLSGLEYAMAMVAFFAAVMSTADTFLGVASLALAKGTLYRASDDLENDGGDRRFVVKLRFLSIVVGLTSWAIAYLWKDIVDIFATAFGVLITFLPAIIGALSRQRYSSKEALWSVWLGLGTVLVLTPYSPTQAFIPAAAVSTIAYLGAMRMFSGAPDEKLGTTN
jgi:solute:Na+ symporter, SSS family